MSDDFITNATAANSKYAELPTSTNSLLIEALSDKLIATFALCDKEGKASEDKTTVKGMFTDGDMSIESQWQTPFENSNPENKLPTLMAGIQSGEMLEAGGKVVSNLAGDYAKKITDAIDPLTSTLRNGLNGLVGKTNLTKVNTQQVFLSTASVRLSLSLSFIAIKDAREEVEKPISILQQWALPKFLYDDSLITSVSKDGLSGLYPSEIPPFVSLTLHGKTYKPLIIESVHAPLNAPIDSNGNRLAVTVQVNVITLTAWDKQDIVDLYK
ncbi:hypothetical protein GCM10023206_06670 [Acinetobacter puyangensis]|uniref:Uncharacterized protein n=1 Tax=Acinetobacter puyangensis TaxID=1096779 RepID=A0A240E664_9GAMM|nr:hypothetical protein [Acinetobacter puyangensis]SNX44254.1 hypothetical protein SAMN05421731_102415 [Acinetobacter puyangensis]